MKNAKGVLPHTDLPYEIVFADEHDGSQLNYSEIWVSAGEPTTGNMKGAAPKGYPRLRAVIGQTDEGFRIAVWDDEIAEEPIFRYEVGKGIDIPELVSQIRRVNRLNASLIPVFPEAP